MIPTTWLPVHRAEDHELVGYLEPVAEGFQARTLFGYPVGDPGGRDGGEGALVAIGLGYLAERWLLPVEGRGDPLTVQIVEVDAHQVTAQSVDFGPGGDYGRRFTLPVPDAGGRLRPERHGGL